MLKVWGRCLANSKILAVNNGCVEVPEEHRRYTFPTEGVTDSVIMSDIDTLLRVHLRFLTE